MSARHESARVKAFLGNYDSETQARFRANPIMELCIQSVHAEVARNFAAGGGVVKDAVPDKPTAIKPTPKPVIIEEPPEVDVLLGDLFG